MYKGRFVGIFDTLLFSIVLYIFYSFIQSYCLKTFLFRVYVFIRFGGYIYDGYRKN